jgi:cytochrome c
MQNLKKLLGELSIKLKALDLKTLGQAVGISLSLVLVVTVFANLTYQQKKDIKRGFEIELSADGKPVVKKEEKPVDLSTLLATADFDRGAKSFKKCASCHSIGKGEAAKVGPNLFGIVGRKKASTSFSYSEAMKAKGGAWDIESINQFITKPKDFVSGTKMAFAGLKKPQERADVILFLQKQK